jgi:16S rRNA (guanine966-N2)-methyltransferase
MTRIVSGSARGRRLTVPPSGVRPTGDRAREGLFNSLGSLLDLEDAVVLDLYAGSGALGLEALSRGAAHATFFETGRAALQALHANVASCRAEARCTILPANVLRPPTGQACGLLFLDPPYGQDLVAPALVALHAAGWIAPGTLIVAEIGRDDPLPCQDPVDDRVQGAARVLAWRSKS